MTFVNFKNVMTRTYVFYEYISIQTVPIIYGYFVIHSSILFLVSNATCVTRKKQYTYDCTYAVMIRIVNDFNYFPNNHVRDEVFGLLRLYCVAQRDIYDEPSKQYEIARSHVK